MTDNKTYLPVKEYSEKKNIPLSTVYKMIKDKQLKTKKIGTYTLVEA